MVDLGFVEESRNVGVDQNETGDTRVRGCRQKANKTSVGVGHEDDGPPYFAGGKRRAQGPHLVADPIRSGARLACSESCSIINDGCDRVCALLYRDIASRGLGGHRRLTVGRGSKYPDCRTLCDVKRPFERCPARSMDKA